VYQPSGFIGRFFFAPNITSLIDLLFVTVMVATDSLLKKLRHC